MMKINYEELMKYDTENTRLYERVTNKAVELAQKNTNLELEKIAREQAREKIEEESVHKEVYYEIKEKILDNLKNTRYNVVYKEEYDRAVEQLLKKYSLKNCLIFREQTYDKIQKSVIKNGKWPSRKEIGEIHRKEVKKHILLAFGLSSALGLGIGAGTAEIINSSDKGPINDLQEEAQEIEKESQKSEREKAYSEIFPSSNEVQYDKLLNYLKQRVVEAYNAEYGKNITIEDVTIRKEQYYISLHEDKAEDGSKIVRIDKELNDTGKYQSASIITVKINGEEIIATREKNLLGINTNNFVKVYKPSEEAKTAEENLLTKNGLAEFLDSGIKLYDTRKADIKYNKDKVEDFKESTEKYDQNLLENPKIEIDDNGKITIQYGVSINNQTNTTNEEINWMDGLKVPESSMQETTNQLDNYNLDETYAVDLEENDERI